MFPENVKAPDIPLYLAFAKDRRLLREIWGSTNNTKIVTIVALDLENQLKGQSDKRVTRHILVDSNQNKKHKFAFTPPGFGVTSEHVGQQDDLYSLLEEAIKDHKLPKHEVVLTDFAIPVDPLANPHNPANDAWYSIELFVRRAEQAVGPVTIKVPPFRARVPPTAAPEAALVPAAAPTPRTPPWLPDTATPITQNDNRRKSWSSSTIAHNPNLIPVNPTRDRLSRKRKMGDRGEDDESSGGYKGSLKRSFSSSTVHEVLQKQQGLRKEKLAHHS
ncbi:hypothetical protein VP1G_08318 [Cytospora mali]|uniref:Uncharacterized protein n=1 Tax=Cytospora mali TaxID=578113 RepID=A0A194VBA0_CYTMA|nr:hypothetical protein VP1G_08318 [Valsa mali var. pyri (nom. inval.)]